MSSNTHLISFAGSALQRVSNTAQPLYNTIIGVHANFCVSYFKLADMTEKLLTGTQSLNPNMLYQKKNEVIYKKSVLHDHLGSKHCSILPVYPKPCCNEQCYKGFEVYLNYTVLPEYNKPPSHVQTIQSKPQTGTLPPRTRIQTAKAAAILIATMQ